MVGPLFSLAATVMTILAVWIALQEALGLRRLAAILIPIVGFVVLAFAVAATGVLVSGIALTIKTLLSQLELGAGEVGPILWTTDRPKTILKKSVQTVGSGHAIRPIYTYKCCQYL